MSAIAGIIGPTIAHPDSASHVAIMARELKKGSDEPTFEGTVRDDGRSVQIAWSRRAYEPECAAWNERGDIGLIFIGNDFDLNTKSVSTPDIDGRNVLPARRLISLYERSGANFVADINGSFTGLLIDRRTGTVTLFNDRYGLNRVYFHANPNGFFFSSKASSLLALLPDLRRIDQRCLAEFFSLGCVLQNRTLFPGISLLPPASRWVIHRDGSITRDRYFDPSTWEQQEPLAPIEYSAQLTDVFSRIVPKYLKASAPVAMSLTGGLDSRMILAWAKAAPQALPCYTFGGPYRDCADVRIARRLAILCNQPHTTLQIGFDFFTHFPKLAEAAVSATDGTMDVSGAVELYANRLAREISPIRVTGNYGSEVLRSHVAFRPAALDTSLFTPDFRILIKEAAATYESEAKGHRLSFIAFKQVPWHHYARFAAESVNVTPVSPFLDNELVALAYRAPLELFGSAIPALQVVSNGNRSLAAIGTDRALRLRSVPIYSRLGHTWQEFTAKAEYAYDYGMPQWLAKADRMLKRAHLEKLFLGRHKFYHFRIWYRDQLAVALRDGSFDFSSQPSCYVEGTARKLILDHTSGCGNRTLELHKLLTVYLIERFVSTTSCRS